MWKKKSSGSRYQGIEEPELAFQAQEPWPHEFPGGKTARVVSLFTREARSTLWWRSIVSAMPSYTPMDVEYLKLNGDMDLLPTVSNTGRQQESCCTLVWPPSQTFPVQLESCATVSTTSVRPEWHQKTFVIPQTHEYWGWSLPQTKARNECAT